MSKETLSTIRGYDYEDEQARLEQESKSQENVGSLLLGAFSKGNRFNQLTGQQEPIVEEVYEED